VTATRSGAASRIVSLGSVAIDMSLHDEAARLLDPLQSADQLRRMAGAWLEAAGFGPLETPARLVHAEPGFELLGYAEPDHAGRVILLVPAPIKRAYIWDLAPAVSVVRRCLERDLRVYLLRWTEPAEIVRDFGLAQYADTLIAHAAAAIAAETGEQRLVLAGHSLGGTLAAIFAARRPERVRGLVLLESPLRFGASGAGAFAPLIAAAPSACCITDVFDLVPGSLLSVAAAIAAPDAFVWPRWIDRLTSVADPERLALHYRVERWTLDELSMTGRLFEDVVDLLYREDCFMRRRLTLGGGEARPDRVTAPMLAVVDPGSRVVPPLSTLSFFETVSSSDKTLLQHQGDRDVSLRHVGVLVGRTAHQRLWPRIVDWVARRQ
jgi:polyhydroxyalkanoate synthase